MGGTSAVQEETFAAIMQKLADIRSNNVDGWRIRA
jgi:hypothetical protein